MLILQQSAPVYQHTVHCICGCCSLFHYLPSFYSSPLHCLPPHLPRSLMPCSMSWESFLHKQVSIMSAGLGRGQTIGLCNTEELGGETDSAGRTLRERLKLWWEQASSTQRPAASSPSIMFADKHSVRSRRTVWVSLWGCGAQPAWFYYLHYLCGCLWTYGST